MTEYIFYKISCIDKNIDYTYIGSTKNFRRRKCEHKCYTTNEACKKYNSPIYKTIRENGGWENWSMVPIGKGIFENKIDALIEEQKYINDNNSILNANKAFMTKEDRYTYMKQYRINNPEQVKESDKKYRETHKEEIKEMQKKYRETHKEELIESSKMYRETHKEEINAKKKEKTICECGGCYTNCHKARHFKTNRHIAHFS
jgi:hypothetical protein